MSESKVIVGVMPKFGEIVSEETGETTRFDKISGRGGWSWLRLQMGKTAADKALKEYKQERGIKRFTQDDFLEFYGSVGEQRTIQYILLGGEVYSVATTDHLLIPPEDVLKIAQRVIPDLKPEANFSGVLKELTELPGIKVKFHLDPGNIFTREAIRMGLGMRVIACFNPLTFVGGNHFNRFFKGGMGMGEKYNKILRFKHKTEIEDRIKEALGESDTSKLARELNAAKKTEVTPEQAEVLLTSFPLAYNAGKETIQQIMDRYKKEDKTIWGLAQAASWVARRGDFRASSKHMDQRLATAGAALLNISDVNAVTQNCLDWLEKHKINLEDYR